MCGIAGIVHFDGRPVDHGLLRRMADALRHRGPDDEGIVTWPLADVPPGGVASAGLVSRRLSIIDVHGGHQPIASETRDIWTVLNGEIYNFAELREALGRQGHRFTTRTDTETIVHAYEEYGDEFVKHLDGMFALALWDGRRQRLVLARDRFGKKPLFYRAAGADIAFASELQALSHVPGWSREIDPEALGYYLGYMAIPAPQTIYRDVRKLPAAHQLVADGAGATVTRYWSLSFAPKLQIDAESATERMRELLTAAVRRRLVSDVPLGAFLSGGIDSSAVVALMAEASSRPVKTFSIGFDDARYNELPYARRIAQAFGCEHHEFVVQPKAIDVLPRLVRHFGEPFADSSAVPTSYLAALTREHVTVALTGDGGDELFAGYGRHRGNRLAEWWGGSPPASPGAASGLDARPGPDARRRWSRLRRFVAAAGLARADRYRAWAGVFSPEAMRDLAPTLPDGQREVARLFGEAQHLDAVDAMLFVDTMFYLPTDLLTKMDICTMAHSLEVRSPFLDRELAEFAAGLPSALKLHGVKTKYLLKRALKGRIPADTLRRGKRGFAVPIAAWFRGELQEFLRDHLQPAHVAAAGLVRQGAVDALIDQHTSGAVDRAHQLWTLLMLELWHRSVAAA